MKKNGRNARPPMIPKALSIVDTKNALNYSTPVLEEKSLGRIGTKEKVRLFQEKRKNN